MQGLNPHCGGGGVRAVFTNPVHTVLSKSLLLQPEMSVLVDPLNDSKTSRMHKSRAAQS